MFSAIAIIDKASKPLTIPIMMITTPKTASTGHGTFRFFIDLLWRMG
jgi:hypothetical protein